MNEKEPPRRVMVLLVGGRLTPNFIGVLAYQPDRVECVVSEDEEFKYQDVLEVLSGIPQVKLPSEPRCVPAFEMQRVVDACQKVVDAYPGAEIIFNVTCATKVMAIAAYEVAKRAGQRAIYVDTTHARFLNLTDRDEQPIPIEVDIENYLSFYGRSPHSTFDFDDLSVTKDAALEASAYLSRAGMTAVETLTIMRRNNRGKGRRTIKLKQPLDSEQWEVLRGLDRCGLISNLSKSSEEEVSYLIANNADWNFLNGTWLEAWTWHQAQQCVDDAGKCLFDACELSLEIPGQSGARKEIDIACVYRGQLLHCSCKSEKSPFKTSYLDELRAVSSLLGGRFCSRLFVTNVYKPAEGDGGWKDYQSFLNQAHDRQIVVVTGESLVDIGAILKREAETPTYWRV